MYIRAFRAFSVRAFYVVLSAFLAQGAVLGLAVRHRSDVADTFELSLISAVFCSIVSGCAYLFVGDLWSKVLCRRWPKIDHFWLGIAILLVSLCGLALTSAILSKIFLGLVAVVISGLVAAAITITANSSGVSAVKRLRLTHSILGICFVASFVTVPYREQPLVKRWNVEGPTVRVMSWNLGLGQPASAPSPQRFLTSIAATIAKIDADVILLQEVASVAYVAELREALGPQWQSIRSRPEDGMITAVLSRLPGQFAAPLPQAPYGGPALFILGTNPAIRFVSIHLPPERNAESRLRYAKRLLSLLGDSGDPVVIGGDFNIDDESFWDRVSPVFTDSLSVDRDTLLTLGSLGTDWGEATASTAVMSRRIDRLLISPQARVSRFEVVKHQRRGRMDHDPIFAEFSLSRKP